MREMACRFGERGQLVGVATVPDGAPRAAVLLATAGLTPKAGPFRLYAALARRLAQENLAVLRFDLGGIGDSAQVYGALPLETRTELELRSAADHLKALAPEGGLIVGGLCSGAEDAVRYAAADKRVTGVFMIDPFAYRTKGWVWRDKLIRGARRALSATGAISTGGGRDATLVDYEPMRRERAELLLRGLIDRGVGLHFLYTGGARETFNHRAQFEVMFKGLDFRGLAAVDFFPQLRHTQVLEADRRLLIDAIAGGLAPRMLRCPA